MSGGIQFGGYGSGGWWEGELEAFITNEDGEKNWALGIYIANKGFSEIIENVNPHLGSPDTMSAIQWMTKVNMGKFPFVTLSNPPPEM